MLFVILHAAARPKLLYAYYRYDVLVIVIQLNKMEMSDVREKKPNAHFILQSIFEVYGITLAEPGIRVGLLHLNIQGMGSRRNGI